MKPTRRWLIAGSACALLAVAAILLAPYLYAEYFFDYQGGVPRLQPKPTGSVMGQWFDDYFLVETIDPTTFAIGEPRYYQGNYSYLILGDQRAVLFDAGTGFRDIIPVVRSLTHLPVTVIASHLHFDHVGALGHFDKTAALDTPSLHARTLDSRLTLNRYEFLGFADRLPIPSFKVDEWWADGTSVDLGGRVLRVVATPGHTPTSVSLYDAARKQLFLGDFLYPGELYAFLPGASRSAYLETTERLLTVIDPEARLFAGHMADTPTAVRAPIMGIRDLQALQTTLVAIDQGKATGSGFYPRKYPVSDTMTFATGWQWNNR